MYVPVFLVCFGLVLISMIEIYLSIDPNDICESCLLAPLDENDIVKIENGDFGNNLAEDIEQRWNETHSGNFI